MTEKEERIGALRALLPTTQRYTPPGLFEAVDRLLEQRRARMAWGRFRIDPEDRKKVAWTTLWLLPKHLVRVDAAVELPPMGHDLTEAFVDASAEWRRIDDIVRFAKRNVQPYIDPVDRRWTFTSGETATVAFADGSSLLIGLEDGDQENASLRAPFVAELHRAWA